MAFRDGFMGINVPQEPPNAYLLNIQRSIGRRYGILCMVHIQYGFGGENLIVATWGEDCSISVKESDMGPARLFDFMNLFHTKIRDKYPEFFL